MKSKVLTPEEAYRLKRYQELDRRIQADHAEIIGKTASYWSAIYEIYTDRLWESAYPSQKDWLGSLSKTMYGPSRSQFFQVMRVFDSLLQSGVPLPDVLFAVATNKTAIIHDLPHLFRRIGKRQYEARPGVVEALGGDMQMAVRGIAASSSSDARAMVGAARGIRRVYVVEIRWLPRTLLARMCETGGEGPDRYYDVAVRVSERSPGLDDWLEARFQPKGEGC